MCRPRKKQAIIPQARLLKCLTLMNALHTSNLTVKQMSLLFDLHERSVYRYLTLFEAAGILIEKDFRNRYFIPR